MANGLRKVLVLCTGNSCRSQMAEAYIRQFAGNAVEVYSAGIETHGLNPKAVAVLAEDGIDISKHSSKHVDDLKGINFDFILTVCDHANENCPYIHGNAIRIHNNFPDPAKAIGNTEEIMQSFREVRDMIKFYSKEFVKTYL